MAAVHLFLYLEVAPGKNFDLGSNSFNSDTNAAAAGAAAGAAAAVFFIPGVAWAQGPQVATPGNEKKTAAAAAPAAAASVPEYFFWTLNKKFSLHGDCSPCVTKYKGLFQTASHVVRNDKMLCVERSECPSLKRQVVARGQNHD